MSYEFWCVVSPPAPSPRFSGGLVGGCFKFWVFGFLGFLFVCFSFLVLFFCLVGWFCLVLGMNPEPQTCQANALRPNHSPQWWTLGQDSVSKPHL